MLGTRRLSLSVAISNEAKTLGDNVRAAVSGFMPGQLGP